MRSGSHPPPSADDVLALFDRLLGDFTPDMLTIEEENVPWEAPNWDGGERASYLQGIFDSLHASHPEQNVLTWYTSHTQDNAPGETVSGHLWPNLASDGWVFDQYAMSDACYPLYVDSLSAHAKKPAVSLVWASPNWVIGPASGCAVRSDCTGATAPDCRPGDLVRNNAWWNLAGWKRFYRQLYTNHQYGIPTALFTVCLDASGNQVVPWRSTDSRCVNFLRAALDTPVKQALASGPVGPDNPYFPEPTPAVKPAWVPAY
jgi:hypothetical protein